MRAHVRLASGPPPDLAWNTVSERMRCSDTVLSVSVEMSTAWHRPASAHAEVNVYAVALGYHYQYVAVTQALALAPVAFPLKRVLTTAGSLTVRLTH